MSCYLFSVADNLRVFCGVFAILAFFGAYASGASMFLASKEESKIWGQYALAGCAVLLLLCAGGLVFVPDPDYFGAVLEACK